MSDKEQKMLALTKKAWRAWVRSKGGCSAALSHMELHPNHFSKHALTMQKFGFKMPGWTRGLKK